jgi:hypothetical protein
MRTVGLHRVAVWVDDWHSNRSSQFVTLMPYNTAYYNSGQWTSILAVI